MSSTTILLREDIETLGGRGEIVKVKSGYARNYLLPNKKALRSNASNLKVFEANRDQLDDPDLIKPGQVLKIPARED